MSCQVAFCLSRYSLANSPSILNLLEFLSERCPVTVFLQQMALAEVGVLAKPSVRAIEVPERGARRWPLARLRALCRSFSHHIAFDPHGLCLCGDLFPRARPFYYSLELYLRNDHAGLDYPAEVMERERRSIGDLRGLIIQSREKEELFRADYGLDAKVPCLILPVTYRGPSSGDKSEMLRGEYRVPSGRRLALHLGGIAEWFSCLEIAEVFAGLDGWGLVFQGYPAPGYEVRLRQVVREWGGGRIHIRDRRPSELAEIDEVVRSCDLGLAWYNDLSAGFRACGLSSGKIPAYFRFGLPVLAKRYPSTEEAIERSGCGVCVDAFDEIPAAIEKIERDYRAYSRAALAEYEARYRFERYETAILDFLGIGGC